MIAVPVRRFTGEEYHRMAEVGILQPDERVELLNGEIIPMLPIGPFHGGSVNRLIRIFERLGQGRWVTSPQNSIRLGLHSEPQPDIALLRPRDDFYTTALATPADVYLVVEVSDSSLLLDREGKLPLYAAAGIPEVWILNVPQKVVEVYRRPAGAAYTEKLTIAPGEPLAPAAFSDAAIDTAALLKGSASQ